jgi:hypothetical protein
VEQTCAGSAPPTPLRWIDDFEGGSNVFDPSSLLGWDALADSVNGTTRIIGGDGPVPYYPLAGWGAHDASKKQGLRLRAYIAEPAPGTNNWGAMWRFETPLVAVNRKVLDFSAYSGMVIWLRGAGQPGKASLTLSVPTTETTSAAQGGDGTCSSGSTGNVCGAHFQGLCRTWKTCWEPLTIPFTSLRVPTGTGPNGGFDKTHVLGIELVASAVNTGSKANFPVDALIDDVYLY